VWLADEKTLSFPSLEASTGADVCIVGGGVSGLTVAYMLAAAGRRVIVLDDGRGGESMRTTAHLSNALDDRYATLERLHGARGAQLAAQSHTAAIEIIGRIVESQGIDCDFERLDGYLFAARGGNATALDDEQKAAVRAGLGEVERVARAPLVFDTGPALRFPRQGQFHPLRYLHGLARAVQEHRGSLARAHAIEFERRDDDWRIGTEEGHDVVARHVIIATNTPVNDRFTIHTKQAAYRTYVIAAVIPRDSVPRALYWDDGDPYHYVRLFSPRAAADEYIIIGGEDHKTGQADDGDARFTQLEAWGRERFPWMREVRFRWSGQVMEPVDALAFLGKNPGDDNMYVMTGDSGQGYTHATLGARLIADLIVSGASPWETLYDPSRRTLRAAATYARENLNVAAQYGALVTPGDGIARRDIPLGSGAVLRDGVSKIAVYHAHDGTFVERSAFCPHLGCVVEWNSTEHSWDCPCHGSRFAADGPVLHGPAIAPLAEIERGRSTLGDAPVAGTSAVPEATG
jgi:glycine/D-amino acid oxidase-like deaminating enzyme/nitrite reductase/ring-hydroxylating ferredoxin subunit